MAENENKNLKDDEYEVDSVGEKIINGIKSNISLLVVVIIAIVYIFSGYTEISFQYEDIKSVICGAVICLLVSWVIKSLLGKQGLLNGLKSEKVVDTQTTYERACSDNAGISEYYSVFCDIKNEQKLKNYQASLLTSVNLKYSKFINGEYDNTDSYTNLKGEKILFTKKQKKALKKARNPKIAYITPEYLTSEMTTSGFREKGEDTPSKYEKKRNTKTLFSAMAIGIIGGFFTISMLVNSSLANLIWTTIQVLVYIATGLTEYITRYIWARTEHISFIKKRTNYLKEFKNMVDSKNEILMNRIEKYTREEINKEMEE